MVIIETVVEHFGGMLGCLLQHVKDCLQGVGYTLLARAYSVHVAVWSAPELWP